MKISAFIVAYNEEKHIERCLKSLADVVDEIVLIHDGECSDNTLEIAKKYKAHIYIQEHKGMREFHQVFALNQCKHEWILQIDADEFLSSDLKNNLRNLVQKDNIDAYAFVWPLWDGKGYFTKDFPYKKVLFRKSKMYYFSFPGKDPNTYGSLENAKYILEHRPIYNNYTLKSFKNKWLKWIKVHARFFYYKEYGQYNCNKEIIAEYQNKIELQKKYAKPILAPLWMVQSIVVSMLRHGYWKSLKTWKVAFLQGLYGFYLCIYIWKYHK